MPQNTSRGYPYPLYTEPQNPPGDLQALATAVNTDVAVLDAARLAALDEPTVRVGSSTTQNVNGSTVTPLTWSAASYDNAGMWSSGSPTVITFTVTGIYLLSARLEVAVSGTATEVGTYTQMVTSGAFGPTPVAQSLRMSQTAPTRPDLYAIYYVAAVGETLGVSFFHDHTTAKSVGARNLTATRISIIGGLP
ncbi:hypothetical protein [Streptomyces scopuliridis]|uniref:Uncharacterized protein n=1 Tax=Streptomyces scopuliridis TaxID=452529 RepID=A0ACD4ZPU4_9ACTN|nr:hypothetical protein [Streptomyces scopuliridis]WSC00047.1 hypothetical protein OG835_25680 [Streptomyces scopuliridis]